MTTTKQGPGLRGIQKTTVKIQQISFDGEFVRLEGEPVGLAIRQEVFAEWLMLKNYKAYSAGLTESEGTFFDWYYSEFEKSFPNWEIEKALKKYIESQTSFLINYE